MRRITTFFTVVVLCLGALQGCSQPPLPDDADVSTGVSSNVIQHDDVRIVTYSGDVDIMGWQTYRNETMRFEVRYPPTFVVEEKPNEIAIQHIGETMSDQITFTLVHSTLEEQVSKVFRNAYRIEHEGLKIHDPHVRAAIAYFQSGDAQSWFVTYFLMRNGDDPETAEIVQKQPYTIIVAKVEAFPSDAEMDKAREMELEMGPASMLSEPQQILSTFRFL